MTTHLEMSGAFFNTKTAVVLPPDGNKERIAFRKFYEKLSTTFNESMTFSKNGIKFRDIKIQNMVNKANEIYKKYEEAIPVSKREIEDLFALCEIVKQHRVEDKKYAEMLSPIVNTLKNELKALDSLSVNSYLNKKYHTNDTDGVKKGILKDYQSRKTHRKVKGFFQAMNAAINKIGKKRIDQVDNLTRVIVFLKKNDDTLPEEIKQKLLFGVTSEIVDEIEREKGNKFKSRLADYCSEIQNNIKPGKFDREFINSSSDLYRMAKSTHFDAEKLIAGHEKNIENRGRLQRAFTELEKPPKLK